jgi:hypothetical protein
MMLSNIGGINAWLYEPRKRSKNDDDALQRPTVLIISTKDDEGSPPTATATICSKAGNDDDMMVIVNTEDAKMPASHVIEHHQKTEVKFGGRKHAVSKFPNVEYTHGSGNG